MKRAEKKAVTRDALLAAALELFARLGYEETTVAQIVQEAGVAKGTFFNYFQTKEDVLLHVVHDQLLWATEQFTLLAQSAGPVSPGIRDVMVGLVTRMPYTAPLLRAMFRASLAAPGSEEQYTAPARSMVDAMVPVIAAGQSSGELRTDLPAERLAFLAVQTYFGVLWAWAIGPAGEPLGSAMALSFDAFFQGVRR